MRLSPLRPKLSAMALSYDGALVRDHQRGRPLTAEPRASVKAPVLVMDGGRSPRWMRAGNHALSLALPNARYRTLSGQTHVLKAPAHVPALVEFFRAYCPRRTRSLTQLRAGTNLPG
jgi:hypothetical protein